MDEQATFATPRVAAGVLFRNDAGQVLLVKPHYKEGWDLPGGYVERGESPRAAAARELREELSVDWAVGDLLVVDWAPRPGEGDKLLFIFEGGTVGPNDFLEIQIQREELTEAKFHDIHDLNELMPSRLSKRVQRATQARLVYLEFGEEPE